MSTIPEKCIEFDDDRKICVAYENGKKYTLDNEPRFKVQKVKIDKCLQQNEGEKRCDYLMHTNQKESKRAIFVELKGNDISEAVKQIYATIMHFKTEFRTHRIDARIVSSGNVPGIRNTPNYVKLERVVRAQNGNLIISTNRSHTEKI